MIKFWKKENYVHCPVCSNKSLWHCLRPDGASCDSNGNPTGGAGANYYCVRCQEFFLIQLEDEGLWISEELQIPIIEYAKKLKCNSKMEVKSGDDANDDGIPPKDKSLGILPTIL